LQFTVINYSFSGGKVIPLHTILRKYLIAFLFAIPGNEMAQEEVIIPRNRIPIGKPIYPSNVEKIEETE